jgi:hypothetical protein
MRKPRLAKKDCGIAKGTIFRRRGRRCEARIREETGASPHGGFLALGEAGHELDLARGPVAFLKTGNVSHALTADNLGRTTKHS